MFDVKTTDETRLIWEEGITRPSMHEPSWRLVPRLTSLRADVLARLLRGEELTALSDGVVHRTTSFAGTIRALRRVYRWPILTRYIELLSKDGRRMRVAAYSFDQDKVEQTMHQGGERFCFLVEAWRNRYAMKGEA